MSSFHTRLTQSLFVPVAVGVVGWFFGGSIGEGLAAWGLVIGDFAVGVAGFIVTRHLDGRERLGWRTIATGMLLTGTWMLIRTLTDLGVVSSTVETTFAPLRTLKTLAIIGGVLILPWPSIGRLHSLRALLEATAAGLATATITAFVAFLTDVSLDDLGGTPGLVVSSAVVGVTFHVFARRSNSQTDRAVGWMVIALVINLAAQVIDSLGESGLEVGGVAHLAALLALGAAAAVMYELARPPEHTHAGRLTGLSRSQLANGFMYTSIALLLVGQVFTRSFEDTSDLLLTAGIGLLIGLLITIQAITVHLRLTDIDQRRHGFVASLSHEARTPLTVITGALEIVNHEPDLPEELRDELLAAAEAEANAMTRMVEDLVFAGRDSLDKITVTPKLANAVDVIEEAIDTVEIPPSMSLTTELPATILIPIDQYRVRQSVVSVLENATRFGGTRIHLAAVESNGGMLLTVEDDGSGVPPSLQHAIWEPFERGQHRFDTAIPGAGLGLAIVRAVTEAHGGDAWCDRSEGLGGARFSVWLPATG